MVVVVLGLDEGCEGWLVHLLRRRVSSRSWVKNRRDIVRGAPGEVEGEGGA